MACLVSDAASFDTPGGPGGVSIVERKDFQAKRPLWLMNGLKFFLKEHYYFNEPAMKYEIFLNYTH